MKDPFRLVRSLVVSRVTYSLPCYLTKAEKERADIIKTAHKAVLRLSKNISNEKLLSLVLHITFEELDEAQLISQKNRLLQTPAYRNVLERLCYNAQLQAHKQKLPRAIISWYRVTLVLQNMDPNVRSGRRHARVQYIEMEFRFMNAARFTDVALYTGSAKVTVAAVTDHRGTVTSSMSISHSSITEAEEDTIALAIKEGRKLRKPQTILTDSVMK